jgi:RIO-like serine/threonine protein kinase
MLYQVEFNSIIAKNVVRAFKEIHAKGVQHGDVRAENILIREDNSVVVIDFELSEMNAEDSILEAEQKEVRSLLEWWKGRQ